MELRRQVLLQELHLKGFYEATDGRLLRELSVEELSLEKVRLEEKQDNTSISSRVR